MKNNEVLKRIINILIVVILSAVAFLFAAYGLAYKNVSFIEVHFNTLLAVTGVILAIIMVAGILFYLFEKQSAYRMCVCALVLLDIFAVLFFVICALGLLGMISDVESLRDYIQKSGRMAAVIYIIFSFLQVVLLPVPGSVTVAAGVAMFGPWKCSLYSFIGIFLGSIVAFAIGRCIGYKAVCWIVGKDDLDKWQEKLKGKDYLILSIMFLLPLFPDDVLCFVAGLSSMTWNYFFIMIFITRLISVFSTSFSFELIPFNTWWGILVWIVLISLVVLAFVLVWKYSDKIDRVIKDKFKLNRKD